MAYLITKMLLCLLLAALLGLLIGWQLRSLLLGTRQRALQDALDDCQQQLHRAEQERDEIFLKAERLEAANQDLNARLMEAPADEEEEAQPANADLATIARRLQALERTNQLLQSRIDNLDFRSGSQPLSELGMLDSEQIEMFRRIGIETTSQLLDHARDDESREAILRQTTVDADELKRLTEVADLLRIPGITSHSANLLQAGGIHSIAALADKKAYRLALKLKRVNAEKQLLSTAPGASIVGQWINAAIAMRNQS